MINCTIVWCWGNPPSACLWMVLSQVEGFTFSPLLHRLPPSHVSPNAYPSDSSLFCHPIVCSRSFPNCYISCCAFSHFLSKLISTLSVFSFEPENINANVKGNIWLQQKKRDIPTTYQLLFHYTVRRISKGAGKAEIPQPKFFCSYRISACLSVAWGKSTS